MRLLTPFRDLKIRYKLLLGYCAIFILSSILASTTIYHFVRRAIEANIESELQNSTTAILNMVRNAAKVSIKNYLRAVAEKNLDITRDYYRQYRRGRLDEALAKDMARKVMLSQTIGKTGYIYCLNSAGIIDNHPHDALMGADLSPYPFIQEQKRDKEGYLEYDWRNPSETSPRAKALYMTYFEPWDWIISVSSYRNEFKELLNVDDFRDSVMSLKFGKTGYSFVIDSHGKLILHPILEGINILSETDADGRQFVRELIAERTGKITYSWKNPGETHRRKKLVIFNYIPEYDWIVASSSYLDEFYAPLKTIEKIFVLTVSLSLLLVLPLTLWISASITNPLGELMQRFAQGAKGDAGVRMERLSNDEVGTLARYFNTFMERLDKSSRSLRAQIEVREKAEAAIRKSEAKYRELVQNANSIILRVDTRDRITFFNEFAQRFFGYPEQEIMGRSSVGTIMPHNDSDGRPMRSVMARMANAPQSHHYYEMENMRRNGERVWVAWTHKAVRDDAGQIVEYLCIGHDVTEARAAEKEMARMRLYLQKIVDSMPSILVGVDLDERITLFNREAEQLTGMTSQDALGLPVDRVLGRFGPYYKKMIHRAMAEKSTMKTEKVPHPVHHEQRWADIMVYPIQFRRVEGVVIRIDDVTARAHMERVMVQTEKMMSVGGLAAGMAHEINNPLGAMVQSAQNILRRISPDLPANIEAARACGVELTAVCAYLRERQITTFLEGIRTSGQNAAQIVDNMLHFSRKSESHKRAVELVDLLDKTVSLAAHDYDLKKRYDFRSIQIERNFSRDLGMVPCVATEIEQVVLNLLRNAAQAMADYKGQGRPPRIIMRLYRRDDMAVIEVEDNGPGMADKDLKRVFEPFYTTKDVGAGTGLGLSVSYFIITNNHGGTMEVSSKPGQGARFTIRLPMAQGRKARQSRESAA
ncbi:MAG: cache domain-containing protein [Desulfobacteraceae bacterium]|jgi:PAS domain S-box-containing protein